MANSHGIGVKRKDYHRKNRKENKGHRWSGARTVPAIRLIKPTEQSPVITRTAYEDKGFYQHEDLSIEPEDSMEWFEIKSTIAPSVVMYYPPFLRRNEIRKRRFAEMERDGEIVRTGDEMNDRWWEWEDELEYQPVGHQSNEDAPGLRRLVENSAPALPNRLHRVVRVLRGRRGVAQDERINPTLACNQCGHIWYPQESRWTDDDPKICPKCRSRKWQG
jgi:hypothetical protein